MKWVGLAWGLALSWMASGAVVRAQTAGATSEPPAAASVDELVEARRIFSRGLEHADRAEWRDAVTCFRQVMEIRESTPVRYNLGAALVHLGEYPEAEPMLHRVIEDPDADAALVQRARESLAEMEERGGRVTLRVDDMTSGTLVFLDGVFLPRDRLGVEFPLSSGEHDLSIREGGDEVSRRRIRVAPGDRAEVVVSLAMTHASLDEADQARVDEHDRRAARTQIGTTLSDAERRRQRLRNPWLWIGVGAGAMLVGGIVFATTWEPPVNAPAQGNFDTPVLRF